MEISVSFIFKDNLEDSVMGSNENGRLAGYVNALTSLYIGVMVSLSLVASVGAATFPANAGTLGAIPDSNLTTPACQNNSTTFRDVTFTVSGMTGAISSVEIAFNASHTYIQDLEVTLSAPSGQSLLLFSATGTTSTSANACGSFGFRNLQSANTYTFADSASANWWTTVGSVGTGATIPTSTNRTNITAIGGIVAPPPAVTSLNTAFAPATANGTWTLRFRDRGAGDTGTVTGANLTINTATAAGVGVSGRVLTSADGRGLVGARVTLTDQNGSTRSVMTGRGGRYTFDDLEPGQTYIVSVSSRRFNFQPQVIQVTDNIAELNFVPE